MAKTYGNRRCAICALRVSKNGLATSAHAKYHVRVGDTVSTRNGRYKPTPQGVSKARATAATLAELQVACLAAGKVLDATHWTSPDLIAVWDAYNSALHAYMEHGKK